MQEKHDQQLEINRALAARVQDLERDNTALRTRLEEHERAKAGVLDNDSQRVLEAVLALGHDDVEIDAVASHLGMNRAKAKLLLRKLTDQDYLFDRMYTNKDVEYCLADKGTEFLIQKGVIT